jgi:hypothetical protein
VCDKITKSCISGCNTGWYGTTCMNICSDKCVGRICEQINGNCVGKCIDGFYGASCNLHCSENCFDAACNKTTGKIFNIFFYFESKSSCSRCLIVTSHNMKNIS